MNYRSLANDPRLVGTLLHVERTGEVSADPHIDARLVGLGLAYRCGSPDRLLISRRGKAVLRAAGE
jgi:hypothetical protein